MKKNIRLYNMILPPYLLMVFVPWLAALCLIGNDDEPDCSEDVAGKQTDRHRNCHHPQLASELVIRQTYDQSGGKKTDNVTAGRTDQGRKTAFEICKHRNADRAEQNVDEHADRPSFCAEQTAC